MNSLFQASLFVLIAPFASADVLTVAGGGYATFQEAIDAAQDGDTILLPGGAYGPGSIDGKGLSIVGDSSSGTVVGGLVVQNLQIGQRLSVTGLTLRTQPLPGAGLVAGACSGSIRVANCAMYGSEFDAGAEDGARVSACIDVAFSRCSFFGTNGSDCFVGSGNSCTAVDGGSGCRATNSNLALFDCIAVGGRGGASIGGSYAVGGEAGDGLQSSGLAYVSGGSYFGGPGGDACSDGLSNDQFAGSGGSGVFSSGPALEVVGVTGFGSPGGLACVGGANGSDGAPVTALGSLIDWNDTPRGLALIWAAASEPWTILDASYAP